MMVFLVISGTDAELNGHFKWTWTDYGTNVPNLESLAL